MSFFKNKSILELVEELAQYENLPDSEEALSDCFDEHLEECGECAECGQNSLIETLKGDGPMLDESFSNYKDALVSGGIIHEEQANQYEYVGKYS